MTTSSFRYKLWIEGKEFFNKPGARKRRAVYDPSTDNEHQWEVVGGCYIY